MPRSRTRTMPASPFGHHFPRWLVWLTVVGNGVLAGAILASATFAFSTGNWELWPWVTLLLLGLAWVVQTAYLYVTGIRRVRHTSARLVAANEGRTDGLLIPGSARIQRMLALTLVAFATVFIAGLIATSGHYRSIFAILILFVTLSFLANVFSLKRPRLLILSPQGLDSSAFRSHARVSWEDVERIEYVTGMGGQMVFRVTVKPTAATFVETAGQPVLGRGRAAIDVEPAALDLDPLLLALALRLYWRVPGARSELSNGQVPTRLTNAEVAVTSVPTEISSELLAVYKPEQAGH